LKLVECYKSYIGIPDLLLMLIRKIYLIEPNIGVRINSHKEYIILESHQYNR